MSLSDPKTSVHSSKGRFVVIEGRSSLVTLAEDLEQELRAGLRQRDEAEFIDNEQLETGQLLLKV